MRLFGNYADGVGNDSAELDYMNIKRMTGPWNEWRDVDASGYHVWARVEARFLSRRCPRPARVAARDTAERRKYAKQEPIIGGRSKKSFQ